MAASPSTSRCRHGSQPEHQQVVVHQQVQAAMGEPGRPVDQGSEPGRARAMSPPVAPCAVCPFLLDKPGHGRSCDVTDIAVHSARSDPS
jgi:hypothetical protein